MRSRVLYVLSGAPDGTPHWVKYIGEGTDAGFFGPGSASWAVHGGMPTMIAGVRALLMQTLHPGAMAGVHEFSRYREDPLGRLAGTIQWLITITFGDRALAERESQRVIALHERVRGHYVRGDGTESDYRASDDELLMWVHCVFTDAFLGCHETWGDPIPGGPDQYVAEWAKAGELVGVQQPPRSSAELEATLDGFLERGELRYDERVAETIAFLRKPPLPRSMLLSYRIMFAGAVASLPDRYRELLGLKRPRGPVIWANRQLLRALRWVLGAESTSQRAAEARIARVAAAAG